MSTITFAVRSKGGDRVKVLAVPSNRSEEPQFTMADGIAAGLILLAAIGLGCLLLLA